MSSGNGNTTGQDVLEAAMGCFHVLSKSSLEDKVRSELIGKIFQSFGDVQRNGAKQVQPEMERDTNGCCSEKVKSAQEVVGKSSKVEEIRNLQNASMEEVRNFNLFAFLNKAVTQGVLDVKDFNSVVKLTEEFEYRGPLLNELGHERALLELEDLPLQKGSNGSSVEDGRTLYPTDNTLAGIVQVDTPEIATVHLGSATDVKDTISHHVETCKAKKDGTLLEGHATQDTIAHAKYVKDNPNSSFHVENHSCPCSHFKIQNNVSTSLLADGNDQEGRLSTQDTPNPSKGDRSHVTTSKPLNFLEAAKHALNKSTTHTFGNGNKDKRVSASHVSPTLLEGAQLADMTKEEGSRVLVPTEILRRRIELCKFSIIGRVILAKGEEVWPSKKLRERLKEIWNFNSSWRLISLGKGYFHLLLTSQEEYEKVWMRGAINLKPGIMRLQKWVFGIDPTKEKSSNAQVWFRFYNLPWCLWDVSILTALSRKIGSPIRFDNNTFNGDFGHFARVLIDVDLSKTIKEVLQLDCGTNIFDVKVVPENIPHFCSACSNIGHTSNDCRLIRRMVNEAKVTDDCKVDKADLAIKHRFEAHKNQRKGFKGLRHTLQESADQGSKALNLTEPITDFGAQREIQGTKDNHTDDIFVSNKFSALDEMEDIGTCDATKGTNKRNDRELTKENNVEEQHTEDQKMEALKLIREWVDTIKEDKDFGKMIEEYNKEDDPKTSAPNPSKRWSDMIDEEDENQFVPLNVQANGEDMEVNMKTFKISPISKRKKKKHIG